MTKVFSLITNTTTAKLDKYYYWKNVDLATLLPKKYYENVFLKKEANTLPIHCLYNHAIKIKNSYWPPFTMIYKMS